MKIENTSDLELDEFGKNSVISYFIRMSEIHGNKCAVRCGSDEISYSQLLKEAGNIAKYLRNVGVKHSDRIGVDIPGGVELAAAIIGIVMVGGVYVPLAKGLPTKRLLSMFEQARVEHLLNLTGKTNLGVNAHSVSKIRSTVLTGMDEETVLSGKSPIYVNFSSGTTGEPKGIECLHQGVTRLVVSPSFMSLSAKTCMLCCAPPAFDAFTLEFWGPLLNGGQVCFIEEERLDNESLKRNIHEFGVNTVWLTSALFNALTDIDATSFDGLEQLLVGGDIVSPLHVLKVYDVNQDVQIINGYGPTENTTFTCSYLIPRTWDPSSPLPIGRPIEGGDVYIVDEHLEHVTDGKVGELVVTGKGLAKGYLDKAQEADRFIEFKTLEGKQRAYRTGDLGYTDEQNEIRFVGRVDQQVKINGHRIELTAINQVIQNSMGVDSVETLAQGKPGHQSLVTFVRKNGQKRMHKDAIMAALTEQLPPYMLPCDICFVNDLPTTTNGKLDRKALMAEYHVLQRQSKGEHQEFTSLETMVARVWEEELQCHVTGRDADFLHLGGSSIVGLKVVHRISRQLNIEVTVLGLMGTPVLQEFCRNLEFNITGMTDGRAISRVPLNDRVTGVPLTVHQKALWAYCAIWDAESYNLPILYHLDGPIDLERLQQALHEVYLRYDTLHALFSAEEPLLMKSCVQTRALTVIESVTQEGLESLYRQEHHRVFALASGGLFVSRLFRIEENRSALMLNFPHIIIDGVSIEHIWSDIVRLYHGETLPPLALDYFDYLSWLSTSALQMDYWHKKLVNYKLVQLHNVKASQLDESGYLTTLLPTGCARALETYAKESQTSTFTAALYLFGQAISTYTGSQQVVISAPYSNRQLPQFYQLVGYLVSMIPVLCRQSDTLRQFHSGLLEDFAHANADFNRLTSDMGFMNEHGRNPLQQVVFAWQEGLRTPTPLAGVTVTKSDIRHSKAKFPLMLTMYPQDNSYELQWEYDPNLVCEATIKVIESLFIGLMRPGQCEIAPAVSKFCPQRLDYPDSVISQLEKMVREKGGRVAISCGSQGITYDELWSRGQHVAAALQARGLRSGERVGVMLPRGIDLAYALVGISMAGGVYVPISLDETDARKQAIIEECGMRYCFSVKGGQLGDVLDMMCVDTILSINAECFKSVNLMGHNALYINFSSGTTGKPKGIECLHQGVVRLVYLQNFMSLDEQTRMLSCAAIGFDAFTLEFWGPLLNGGQVCFCTESILDTESLKHYIDKDGVNTLWLTAALFHTLVDLDVDAFNGLSQLVVGGDVVSPSHVDSLYRANDEILVINGYGPTENTTFTCCYPIPRHFGKHGALPIGLPINGTDVAILGQHGGVAPKGCIGEIVALGLGVAKGYVNRPNDYGGFGKIDCGYGLQHGYRTGDLGFQDPEGLIRFIGRRDQQVKINGYRVELSAIDQALIGIHNVEMSVSIPIKDFNTQKVVSFVRLSSGCRFSERCLIATLGEQLPHYMVPSQIIRIEKVPLTENGKVDKNALRVALKDKKQNPMKKEALQTETERVVANIWSELLDTRISTREENFFHLGGTSIQSLRVMHRLEERLAIKVPLPAILKKPRLGEFSQFIDELIDQRRADGALVPNTITVEQTHHDSKAWVVASPQQQRLMFTYDIEISHTNFNVIFEQEIGSNLDVEKLETGLTRLLGIEHFLNVRYRMERGRLFYREMSIDALPLEVSVDEERFFEEIVQKEEEHHFNLGSGPCWKAIVYKNSGRFFIAFNIHHLAVDGWTVGLLKQAILDVYNSPDPQTPLHSPYSMYSSTQAEVLTSSYKARAKRHWLSKFGEDYLPFRLTSKYSEEAGIQLFFSLTEAETKDIRLTSKRLATTPFQLLLAWLFVEIQNTFSLNHITIGMPYSSREYGENDRVFGFCSNMLLLQVENPMDKTPKELTHILREDMAEEINHMVYGYDLYFKDMNYEKTDGLFPMTSVFFNNVVENKNTDKNEKITLLKNTKSKTPFDLNIYMFEHESIVEFELVCSRKVFNFDDICQFSTRWLKIGRKIE
ncbi:AMP-binding protein [Vibrio tubiashii]|uniref:AMP-binding protein n=2 Tax=Vibrio tubiashii TaxID=29498 RepID=UPI001EFDF87F|nr:AMP-binding protein [Vibrio tubiashii]MCG9583669.1 AMP-binding protein [Vibrio tubiashii]MCG9617247.1 AMP-binding protein [Vibrio tubiashii]